MPTIFRRLARKATGPQGLATIDTVKASPPPSPLQPINLESEDEINAVLNLATRVGDALVTSGMSNSDARAHIRAVAEAYGIMDLEVDITFNAITVYSAAGPGSGSLSQFRAVSKLSLNFSKLEDVDHLIRDILAGRLSHEAASIKLRTIMVSPAPYGTIPLLILWGGFTAAIAVMNGGGWLAALLGFFSACLIMSGSWWLSARGLPLFFQNVFGGVVATLPAAVVYEVSHFIDIKVNADAIIAAGIVAMLAGLTLFQALQDGITGAPVTASARFFDTTLATGAIIGGVVLGLKLLHMVGIDVISRDQNPAITITSTLTVIITGALAGPCFAAACYARKRPSVVTFVPTVMGCSLYFGILVPLGVGPIASASAAATMIGLAGGLLSRRMHIPPLITAVAGITPLLPGLSLYRGMFAILDGRTMVGFNFVATAFGIATALAAGVVLGEWLARRLRRPAIFSPMAALRPRSREGRRR